jgi:hypothetical protein
MIPLVSARINKIFDQVVLEIAPILTLHFETILVWQAIIFPDVYLVPFANSPIAPFVKDPSSLEYASPSVATGVPNFGLHKVTFREIFIFKNSGHERIRLGSNPPPQFGQQSCIKEISVPETKATLVFILADFLPVNPMDLSSI